MAGIVHLCKKIELEVQNYTIQGTTKVMPTCTLKHTDLYLFSESVHQSSSLNTDPVISYSVFCLFICLSFCNNLT